MFKKVRPLYVINCFWLLNRVLNVGEIVRQVWTNTTKTTQYSRHLEFLRLWRQYTNNRNKGLDEGWWGQVQTSVASLWPSWQKFPSQEYSIKISQSETIESSSKPIRGNIFLLSYKGAWNRKVKPFSLRFLCDGSVWKRCNNIFGKN